MQPWASCTRVRLLTFFLFSSCSWESQWWRRCAETESTAALSSSSLSWAQSSTATIPAPSRRKPTSWRWQFASWDGSTGSSRLTAPAALQLPVRATPGVRKRSSASCPAMKWRRRPREACWAISTTCSLPLTRARLSLHCLSWALQPTTAAARRRLQPAAPSGGPGRVLQALTITPTELNMSVVQGHGQRFSGCRKCSSSSAFAGGLKLCFL